MWRYIVFVLALQAGCSNRDLPHIPDSSLPSTEEISNSFHIAADALIDEYVYGNTLLPIMRTWEEALRAHTVAQMRTALLEWQIAPQLVYEYGDKLYHQMLLLGNDPADRHYIVFGRTCGTLGQVKARSTAIPLVFEVSLETATSLLAMLPEKIAPIVEHSSENIVAEIAFFSLRGLSGYQTVCILSLLYPSIFDDPERYTPTQGTLPYLHLMEELCRVFARRFYSEMPGRYLIPDIPPFYAGVASMHRPMPDGSVGELMTMIPSIPIENPDPAAGCR